jgi:hypothetical protein
MKQKKTTEEKSKSRGLFDHINHIREVKDQEYYTNLSDAEKTTFNKYMIVRFLSMDVDLVEDIAFISKYFQLIPDEQFYKILIEVVPKGRKFCKYIKGSNDNINKTLLECICKKFSVGESDAKDYYNVLKSSELGITDLISLIEGFGYAEKEIEKMLS